ncbi:MAG: DUF4870 domain-containing protein [Acidobacteria bacterium]|nr:DUF4870 domain-containing protein [Acidobacteriota bacterium]
MDQVAPYNPSQDEKMTAMVAYILQIFTWFVGPLVIYFVKRDSRFVAFHALQGLIFQGCMITLSALMGIVWVAFIVWTAVTESVASQASGGPPLAFLISVGVIGLAWVAGYVLNLFLSAYYAVQAANGKWSQYPVIGNWARRWAGIATQQSLATTTDHVPQPPG